MKFNLAPLMLLTIFGTALHAAEGESSGMVTRMDAEDCPTYLQTSVLPQPPRDLSRPQEMTAYIREMNRTLGQNSRQIAETLLKAADRKPHLDYVRRTMGTGKYDKEKLDMLRVHEDLIALTDSIDVGGPMSVREVAGHVNGVGRKLTRLALRVPGARRVIPSSLESRFEVYGHKKPNYQNVIEVVQRMIDDISGRTYEAYNEIIALQDVVDRVGQEADEYKRQRETITRRIEEDEALSPADREFLKNNILIPLADAEQRLRLQVSTYLTQINGRLIFLQKAQPVIENTSSTVTTLIPAMQMAQMAHEDNTLVRELARVKPRLEGYVKRMFEASTATLEKTAAETSDAHKTGVLTADFFEDQNRRLQQISRNEQARKDRLLPELLDSIEKFEKFNANRQREATLGQEVMPALVGPRE